MTLTPWEILNSRYIVHDRWMKLRADECRTIDGLLIAPYYVYEPPDWVHVVALDETQRILLTRQYRHGIGKISTELPCGVIEAGEAPEAAMRRELREETGAEVGRVTSLAVMDPNPARQNNRVHSFLARDTRIVHSQSLDESEEIEFEFVPIEDVHQMIAEGEFTQAMHIASLFLALRELHEATP